MKIFRKQRGITLMALIVTIIVLLILAGISISMVAGDNGIIKQATEAKEKTEIAAIEEKIKLAVSSALMDGLGSINYSDLDTELKNEFGEGGYTISPESDADEWTVTVEDVTYQVTASGDVTGSSTSASGITINLTLTHTNTTLNASSLPNVSEVTSDNVPIPQGFYYVGGTRDTGVVISDEAADYNAGENATLQGNQFVWVPVDQNQVLTLSVTSKEDITGITLTGPDGTETELSASGKNFNQEIEMTKNGVYTVEVTTATTSEKASKRISSLYAQDMEMLVLVGLYYKQQEPDYNSLEELIEDTLGTGKTQEDFLSYLQEQGYETLSEYFAGEYIYVIGYEEEFKAGERKFYSYYVDNNRNLESVNKYGGFYIARYEAGDGTTSSARTSATSDTNTLVSKKGAYVYNYVDLETARTLASGMYSTSSAITSQLITGAGWDRTMNWLIETDNGLTENDVIIDSSSWGNYESSTGNAAINAGYSNMNYTTGRSEYWKANNIYDLAGNTYEWTQETEWSKGVTRGGSCSSNYSPSPAASRRSRRSNDSEFNDYFSFRPQLYIK